MNKAIKLLFFSLGIGLCVFSCNLESILNNASPDFSVKNVMYKEASEELKLPEGVYFNFCNNSRKRLMFLEARLTVYDKKSGKLAFSGTGSITCSYDGYIESMETRELCVPLDSFTPISPDIEYYIDSFFISRVIYADGTEWMDLPGVSSAGTKTLKAIDVTKAIEEFEKQKEAEKEPEPEPEPDPEPEPEPEPEPDPEPEPEPEVDPMQEMPSEKKLTLLVYMAADNDLESYALEDLKEMEHSSFEGINVLVLLDRAQGYDATDGDWTDTRLFELAHDDTDGSFIVSKRLRCPNLGLAATRETELDMSNPSVLYNFINFAKSEYQAQKYALIIWGHGTGWRGLSLNEGHDNYQPYKAIAIDDYTNSYMSVPAMGKALKNSGLCVIGFDTCFGGVFENVYEIKNCVEYTVASPRATPSSGWNYKQLLEDISESDFKTSEIAQFMADSSPVCTTIFDNSRLRDVMDCFEAFAESLSKTVVDRDSRNEVFATLQGIKSFCYAQNPCDLYLDMRSLAQTYSSSANSKLAENSMRLRNSLDRAAKTTYSEVSEVGIHFIPKTESGSLDVRHSLAYIKDSDNADQCLFIKESQWWVPTKDAGSDSLLDKLFYRVF